MDPFARLFNYRNCMHREPINLTVMQVTTTMTKSLPLLLLLLLLLSLSPLSPPLSPLSLSLSPEDIILRLTLVTQLIK